MTIAEFYDRNLEEDDFIKNNFKSDNEKFIAKMTAYYFLFEQDLFIEDEEILDEDFKIKDFDNELEKKENINILADRILKGIERNINYTINNMYLFINDKEDYLANVELFNQYKKDLEEILDNDLIKEDIKKTALMIKNKIDNNLSKLKNPLKIRKKSSLKM